MKPITVWKKFNVHDQCWEHNHIEDGHVPVNQNKPMGTPWQTKIWKASTWLLSHKHLNGKQIVI